MNVVVPGFTLSPLVRELVADPKVYEWNVKNIPMRARRRAGRNRRRRRLPRLGRRLLHDRLVHRRRRRPDRRMRSFRRTYCRAAPPTGFNNQQAKREELRMELRYITGNGSRRARRARRDDGRRPGHHPRLRHPCPRQSLHPADHRRRPGRRQGPRRHARGGAAAGQRSRRPSSSSLRTSPMPAPRASRPRSPANRWPRALNELIDVRRADRPVQPALDRRQGALCRREVGARAAVSSAR